MERTWKALVAVLSVLLTCSVVAAQSTEMDRPTQLTSRDTAAEWGPQPTTYYYTFEAGPGEFSILMAVRPSAGCTFEVLDDNYKKVGGETIWASSGEEQKIDRFTLKKKAKVVLKVGCEQWGPADNRTHNYHFRLSGVVNLPETSNK